MSPPRDRAQHLAAAAEQAGPAGHVHPNRIGSGEWMCLAGEMEGYGRMVTVAKWRDGAILEEHIWN